MTTALVMSARRVLDCPLNVSLTPPLNDLEAAIEPFRDVEDTADGWRMLTELYRVIVRVRGDKPHAYSFNRRTA